MSFLPGFDCRNYTQYSATSCVNAYILYSSAMEDAHTIELRLPNGGGENAFFAVYDGHGGASRLRFIPNPCSYVTVLL